MQPLKICVFVTIGLVCAPGCGGRARGDSRSAPDGELNGGAENVPSSAGTAPLGGDGSGGTTGGAFAQPQGGTSGAKQSMGGRAGQEAIGGQADEPPPRACGDFLALWKVRQGEREPGEPIPPEMADAPCFDCIQQQGSSCGALSVVGCASAEACLERHCLCTTEQPLQRSCSASTYPNDLCACADTCFAKEDSCAPAWARYTQCIIERCSQACGQ
jgi:hypothetical protein